MRNLSLYFQMTIISLLQGFLCAGFNDVPITQESIDYDAKKQTAFIKADSSVLKEDSDDQTVEGNEVGIL
ncbi:hypothetical protein NBO_605g0001 [Nosema bombycis CQ1]|uniref:Uncharacterized protein n=1 Tax=Nosema bombycis (strain CQ1 / CVCC 102059) TaxID=578461 RepID=R0MGT9_NOSB1|nr:hypothetical protein NBO_605g0001 [Nosema bombycis CQ1]|eukprot:EOB11983.1 hypothetical protein NBO_605g0001 [Nosema bombycis CQ1]